MKPENRRRLTIHIRHLSDVSVQRNSYIYTILYKIRRIKQIPQINQSENDDIPHKPENLGFAPVIFI